MPNLSRCKQVGGVLYCWDKETKRIAVVELQFPDPKAIPWEVIAEYIAETEGVTARAQTVPGTVWDRGDCNA